LLSLPLSESLLSFLFVLVSIASVLFPVLLVVAFHQAEFALFVILAFLVGQISLVFIAFFFFVIILAVDLNTILVAPVKCLLNKEAL
jgi:hypothetical protein